MKMHIFHRIYMEGYNHNLNIYDEKNETAESHAENHEP